MDQSMDLYTLPSLNISNCVTVKLTDRNYILWKSQFESFLSGQGLLGFVNGAYAAPTGTVSGPQDAGVTEAIPNPDYQAWFRSDQVVMSEDILSVVVGSKTSHEVWMNLAKHFNRISSSRIFELQRRLHSLSKEGKTMEEYLRYLKTICDQLASVGSPVAEKMKIFAMVHGLTREYEPLITSLEGTLDAFPGPSYEDVVYRLKNFDDRLQGYTVTDVSPHLAFNTFRSSNRGRGGRNNRGKGNFSTRGRGFQQQFSSSSSSVSASEKPMCQICGKRGHYALQCWHRFDDSYQHSEAAAAAFSALHITDVSDDSGWVPDSAATAHITNNSSRLQQMQPYLGNDTVMASDGNFLPITHIGSANLPSTSGNLPLKDVLVCPNIAKSLLSVSKLTKDYPCSFTFDADGVLVKDKATCKVLTKGSSTSEGLYKLENPKFQMFYSTRQVKATDEVWHMRLGHPNPQVLQLLANKKAIQINKSTSKMCESCRLGKSSRLPFIASDFIASRPLERVHCDLWGPAPVSSIQGFQYYVIFIDNRSRFCWFYPLKHKSDFCSLFMKFQSFVENLLQTKIGTFQSDGGGEFTSNRFLQHLQESGIQHYISCPHTPQQNGLAERKHRQLTERGLTLMFQSKAPQRFWVEAFFTANFLSNLLPTSALDSSTTPYQVLFGKAPDYSALRTFGCACFPTLRAYARNKFDPRSLKCIFLGYTEKYKGYRCFFPPTNRVYLSRHVLFDESSFPFIDTYTSLQHPSPTPMFDAWLKSFPSSSSPLENDQTAGFNSGASVPVITAQQTQPILSLKDGPNILLPEGEITVSSNNQDIEDEPICVTPLQTLSSEDNAKSSETLSMGSEECSECTASFDLDPIGNNALSSSPRHDQLTSSIPRAATESTHPMTTRLKKGIIKLNQRYALLTHKVSYPMPKTVTAALKDPKWTAAMIEEMGNCS